MIPIQRPLCTSILEQEDVVSLLAGKVHHFRIVLKKYGIEYDYTMHTFITHQLSTIFIRLEP